MHHAPSRWPRRCAVGRGTLRAMQIQGYMIDVEFDGTTLVAKGRNKAAHFGLVGASLRESKDGLEVPDEMRVDTADIASLDFKLGNPLVNGNLVVQTADEKKYQMHFRRKSNADFTSLYKAICEQRPDLR